MYVALLVCSVRDLLTFSRPHDLIRAALRLPPRPPLVLVVCATTGVLKLHCRQSHILTASGATVYSLQRHTHTRP